MWGDRSLPFKTSHGLNRREALWSAVAAATAFSESKCLRVRAAARAESGSCCDRTPKPASPAARAPTSNSDPPDRFGCGHAALRSLLQDHPLNMVNLPYSVKAFLGVERRVGSRWLKSTIRREYVPGRNNWNPTLVAVGNCRDRIAARCQLETACLLALRRRHNPPSGNFGARSTGSRSALRSRESGGGRRSRTPRFLPSPGFQDQLPTV